MSGTYISGKTDSAFFGGAWVDRIRIEADGAGGAQWQSLLTASNYGAFSYNVTAQRILYIDGAPRGLVGQSGNYFTLAEPDNLAPSMEFGLRPATGLTNTSLSGDYVTGQIRINRPAIAVGLIRVSADGQGVLAVGDFNGNDSSEADYAVQDDGTLATREDEDESYTNEGLVGLNGNAFIWVTDDRDDSLLRVGIRQSSGMSAAALDGTYMVCIIGAVGGVAAARLSMEFDGAGQFTYEVIERSSPFIVGGQSLYSVSTEGILYVDGNRAGIVSADGNLFMRADGFFMIGIRQGV